MDGMSCRGCVKSGCIDRKSIRKNDESELGDSSDVIRVPRVEG
jgi:hypothetical protein